MGLFAKEDTHYVSWAAACQADTWVADADAWVMEAAWVADAAACMAAAYLTTFEVEVQKSPDPIF